MKMKYNFNADQYKEIEEAQKGTRDKKVDKRLEVLKLRCEGKSLKEIAEKTGFHRSHVSNLLKKYTEEGLTAIVELRYSGNHRNMSEDEERCFLESFRKAGESGQLTEVREIKAAYEEKVGHPISSGQIYYVLHRHGWRKVMPRSKHPKSASPEAVEASKKLTMTSDN